jgi:hypothetical protein
MNTNMTTAQYLALVERIGYTPEQAAVIRPRLLAGDAATRFAVYGTALRKGLVKREGKPLSEGKIVACACGASYKDASQAMARLHAGH